MTTPDSEDFAAMLAEFEREQAPASRGPRAGDQVEGQIISIGAEAVFVDLGGKSEGVLDRDQVSDNDGNLQVAVGDTVSATVASVGGKAGAVVLRTQIGKGPDAVAELAQAHELGLPVDGLITATNKGGVEVQMAGLRAF
ncbi:MAG: S1 RNA-binding domain-containing protein [Deltaproteobacteria bacterium]|nr:S1 RNA-binding domain-containing protein [Deltaproteobacteria bacterium]